MSFYSSRWIKRTAKLHTCWWCGHKIALNSAANYASGIGIDDFWHGWAHPECKAAVDSLPYEPDGYEEHEHGRGRNDDDKTGAPMFSDDYRGTKINTKEKQP